MLRKKLSEKIYYHSLKGDRYIFADERLKKKLLDIMAKVHQEEEWYIYAFCITDDCAYFIAGVPGEASLVRGMEKVREAFGRECMRYLPIFETAAQALCIAEMQELNSLKELAESCRRVHRIPLERGYVLRIEDYWWSSYITYIGLYEWGMVDCRILFLYFSANLSQARLQLQEYHRKFPG
jgi:hypothetical protein